MTKRVSFRQVLIGCTRSLFRHKAILCKVAALLFQARQKAVLPVEFGVRGYFGCLCRRFCGMGTRNNSWQGNSSEFVPESMAFYHCGMNRQKYSPFMWTINIEFGCVIFRRSVFFGGEMVTLPATGHKSDSGPRARCGTQPLSSLWY